jgi:hypothetical protein
VPDRPSVIQDSFPMGFLDVGMGHRGSWRCRSSWSGRCLPQRASAAFVGGRGSRLVGGRTPRAGAGAPAASGSRSWCRRRGGRGSTLAAASQMVATSTPSSSAHRGNGAAIGRPKSGSYQVPTKRSYRTHVREGIGNATDCDRTGGAGTEAIRAGCGSKVRLGALGSKWAATVRRKDQHVP